MARRKAKIVKKARKKRTKKIKIPKGGRLYLPGGYYELKTGKWHRTPITSGRVIR